MEDGIESQVVPGAQSGVPALQIPASISRNGGGGGGDGPTAPRQTGGHGGRRASLSDTEMHESILSNHTRVAKFLFPDSLYNVGARGVATGYDGTSSMMDVDRMEMLHLMAIEGESLDGTTKIDSSMREWAAARNVWLYQTNMTKMEHQQQPSQDEDDIETATATERESLPTAQYPEDTRDSIYGKLMLHHICDELLHVALDFVTHSWYPVSTDDDIDAGTDGEADESDEDSASDDDDSTRKAPDLWFPRVKLDEKLERLPLNIHIQQGSSRAELFDFLQARVRAAIGAEHARYVSTPAKVRQLKSFVSAETAVRCVMRALDAIEIPVSLVSKDDIDPATESDEDVYMSIHDLFCMLYWTTPNVNTDGDDKRNSGVQFRRTRDEIFDTGGGVATHIFDMNGNGDDPTPVLCNVDAEKIGVLLPSVPRMGNSLTLREKFTDDTYLSWFGETLRFSWSIGTDTTAVSMVHGMSQIGGDDIMSDKRYTESGLMSIVKRSSRETQRMYAALDRTLKRSPLMLGDEDQLRWFLNVNSTGVSERQKDFVMNPRDRNVARQFFEDRERALHRQFPWRDADENILNIGVRDGYNQYLSSLLAGAMNPIDSGAVLENTPCHLQMPLWRLGQMGQLLRVVEMFIGTEDRSPRKVTTPRYGEDHERASMSPRVHSDTSRTTDSDDDVGDDDGDDLGVIGVPGISLVQYHPLPSRGRGVDTIDGTDESLH
ncbi:hypothetical protein KDA14_00920, partial [Candidatus Saccharibacteria bacterium]|nr:hypothetical protein [Candidatus Saccharibacteria bacterium]